MRRNTKPPKVELQARDAIEDWRSLLILPAKNLSQAIEWTLTISPDA
jgi:hypothetical protein